MTPVADDHHRRKDRVGIARLRTSSPPESIIETISGFDDGHRQRQDQRAERFADPVRDDFGMIDGDQHGGDQGQRDRQQDERAGASAEARQQQTMSDESGTSSVMSGRSRKRGRGMAFSIVAACAAGQACRADGIWMAAGGCAVLVMIVW